MGEWWRGRTDLRDNILDSVDVEPLTEAVAKRAGEARAAIKGATLVDAIVMASAASRGDVVYSSDLEDLERLRRYFPGVRGPSNLKIVWAYKAHWYLENRVRIRTRFSRCKGTVRLRRPTCSVALTRALGEL